MFITQRPARVPAGRAQSTAKIAKEPKAGPQWFVNQQSKRAELLSNANVTKLWIENRQTRAMSCSSSRTSHSCVCLAPIFWNRPADVLQASNADEALHLLETHPEVRVVFSDVEMPGSLDGLGLARCICQRWPRIGIVLTSGHRVRMEMIPQEGRFLAKPYDGKALVRHIEEIIH
jgi:two-component system, response regulator PdtaR